MRIPVRRVLTFVRASRAPVPDGLWTTRPRGHSSRRCRRSGAAGWPHGDLPDGSRPRPPVAARPAGGAARPPPTGLVRRLRRPRGGLVRPLCRAPRSTAVAGAARWAAVVAAGRYRGPLRSAVIAYKERGRRDLAAALSTVLVAPLAQVAGSGEVWLVPAPSRPAAARARGGDHVVRLCRQLARG